MSRMVETMREASFYSKEKSGVRCLLCPHNCLITDGASGICGVRRNSNGVLYSENYGKITAICVDPIEKKPLYHFMPGKKILSVGTYGCNLKCFFCQNWEISQNEVVSGKMTPEQLAAMVDRGEGGTIGVAYTYNEPSIWYEFVLDRSKLVREVGGVNILVTNGFINREPFERLLPYIDGLNIDLKSYSDEFYRRRCKGRLEIVKDNIKLAYFLGKHIEVTNLIIPTLNDGLDEIEEMILFLAGISKDIPIHFSRYYPNYKCELPPTSLDKMVEIYELVSQKMNYVYLGNIMSIKFNSTFCPSCGKILVNREGYSVESRILNGRCSLCGEGIYGVF